LSLNSFHHYSKDIKTYIKMKRIPRLPRPAAQQSPTLGQKLPIAFMGLGLRSADRSSCSQILSRHSDVVQKLNPISFGYRKRHARPWVQMVSWMCTAGNFEPNIPKASSAGTKDLDSD
jgi:hypothetical protein